MSSELLSQSGFSEPRYFWRPMHLISATRCAEWLRERGLRLSERGYPLISEQEVLEFPVSGSFGESLALAYMFGDMQRAIERQGGMLVIREWDIGSPGFDAIGHEIVKRMLSAEAASEPPCILLESTEADIVPAMLLQALVFGWDAYYVPDSGAFLIFISHDDVIYVAMKDPIDSVDVEIQFERLSVGRVPVPYYLSQSSNERAAQ